MDVDDLDLDDGEEPVVCTGCDRTPVLIYKPSSDHTYQLVCGCPLTAVDVTDDVESTKLVDFTGKWSNVDYDSTMRYNDT